jgi:hypothetical protein
VAWAAKQPMPPIKSNQIKTEDFSMPAQSSKKKSTSKRQTAPVTERPRWVRVLLLLTLVPMAIGVLLILAWALDWDLFGRLDDQIVLGTLFLLASFSASNALQQKWYPAAGWLLLAIADGLILSGRHIALQAVGVGLGVGGLTLLGIEFYERYKSQNSKK